MCPAACSKPEVLSYASRDGKKVERGRGSFLGRSNNNSLEKKSDRAGGSAAGASRAPGRGAGLRKREVLNSWSREGGGPAHDRTL